MFTIEIVGTTKSGCRVLTSKALHVSSLSDAQVWARHEFDLELHLAPYMGTSDAPAALVQVLRDGQVVWKLTQAERVLERRREPQ
ncbi:hypothetical protein HCU64_23265 [Methylobacterium sp. C25]|uniref:hypothetical protein n=1 Tax=Methylobacterium sp. C25 TaxID=2721622 RepID=UPI001F4811B9|nr:hypothetical protein [Methylobacterium sp. C25]MCE4226666.1 hypothetical protein [Methylobacterium sp. C25]